MTNDSSQPIIADIVAPKRDETIIGLLQNAARDYPEKPFVIFPDHGDYHMSYAAALRGAEHVARALRGSGIKPGARIAIYLTNSPAFVWAWMGTLLAATVDVTVNTGLRGGPLAYALNKARIDAVITDRDGLAGLASLTGVGQEPPVILLEDAEAALSQSPSGLRWGDWTGQAQLITAADSEMDFTPGNPLGLASIRFTSGSTGFPKGVMMSQAHMLANARMYGYVSGFQATDVLYTSFPVHHVFSSVMGILSALCSQGTLVLARKFSASQFWEHIRRYDVTISQILDAPAVILMSRPESELDRAHKCRVMYTTSVAMPRFEERFGVKILALFDMSELTAIACYPPGVPHREGSCGVSSTLFDITILDDDDYPVAPGIEGQIAVRPRVPHVMMMGYFDDAELVVERWSNLWYHTNDRGILDVDGYLYFKGRLGDRIRRRGDNVSASELEAVAAQHTDVAETAVIGVPAASMGENEIKLCVILKQGRIALPKDILDHMARDLPAALVPRYVEIRSDFPRTETEKIRKNVLREEGDHGLTPTTWDSVKGCLVESATSS